MQDATDGFENTDVSLYLATGIKMIIGVAIAVFVNETVEIVEE
jgi:hypothetical protein